jgi:hypothetical protein
MNFKARVKAKKLFMAYGTRKRGRMHLEGLRLHLGPRHQEAIIISRKSAASPEGVCRNTWYNTRVPRS